MSDAFGALFVIVAGATGMILCYLDGHDKGVQDAAAQEMKPEGDVEKWWKEALIDARARIEKEGIK